MQRTMLFLFIFFLHASSPAQLTFETTTKILDTDPGSESIIWFDYNNDGVLDLFVNGSSSTGSTVGKLFLNDQNRFIQIADLANIPASKAGAAPGDFDNDGDIDLFLAGLDDLSSLYRNNGDGAFENITQEAGLLLSANNYITTCSFFDYDNDGHLDLFLGSFTSSDFMFRNNGDGTFTDATETTGLKETIRNTTGHMFGDFDNDGFMDLYVTSQRTLVGTLQSFTRNQIGALYKNRGNGTFTDITQQANLNYSQADVRDALFFDYDNDGWLDLFLPTWGDGASSNLLYRNVGDGTFRNTATLARIAGRASSRSVTSADLDNDGFIDLYVGNDGFDTVTQQYRETDKYTNHLFMNNQDATFIQRVSQAGVNDSEITFNVSAADYDADGFIDLYAANQQILQRNEGQDILFRNNGNTNHWLHIDLVGVQSNRSGIGSRIVVTAGELSMIREVNGGDGRGDNALRVEFGLGAHAQADRIDIRWPSGQTDVFNNVPANQRIRILEGSDTVHPIRPTTWAGIFPESVSLFEHFNAVATVKVALFEPGATIDKVILSGLGDGRTIALEDKGDRTFQLEAENLFVSGKEGQRMLAFQIEQMTSRGPFKTVLPIILNVTPSLPPALTLPQTDLSFGDIEINRSSSITFTIQNGGQGPLIVTQIQSDIAGLSGFRNNFSVRANSSQAVTLSFVPNKEGPFSGTLEIFSNDVNQSIVQVPISGNAVVIFADPQVDFNADGHIDFSDFLIFVNAFGTTNPTFDLDNNGLVDFADFLTFSRSFGRPTK